MKRPHMSTGAWIFASVVAAAVVAPASVYAATSETVSIGNIGASTTTATVTTQHQLLTANVAPNNVVRFYARVLANSPCEVAYTPPKDKAIVLTQVTYSFGTGSSSLSDVYLEDDSCTTFPTDMVDTTDSYASQAHTFPSGLPMSEIDVFNPESHAILITGSGYLIPSALMPPPVTGTVP